MFLWTTIRSSAKLRPQIVHRERPGGIGSSSVPPYEDTAEATEGRFRRLLSAICADLLRSEIKMTGYKYFFK